MTDQKLQDEYYTLLKEFEEGNRRMKRIKQRMVQIRKTIKIHPKIVDDRPDELILKDPYLR